MSDLLAKVFEDIHATTHSLAARMVAAASCSHEWPKGSLDVGPIPPEASEQAARQYLMAVEAWVLEHDAEPLVAWCGRPRTAGLLAFTTIAREALLSAGRELGCAEAYGLLQERLDELCGLLSARLDEVLAREEHGIEALILQLEGIHGLASPLNVVTLQAELAHMRLSAGATDAAIESLDELMTAADRLIDDRRELSNKTEGWCHELRRAHKDAKAPIPDDR